MFFKILPSLDPVDFVRRICQEVVEKPDIRRMRYINRLTPMTLMTKASEKGLEELVKTVLPEHFQLAEAEVDGESRTESKEIATRIPNPPSVSFWSQKILS